MRPSRPNPRRNDGFKGRAVRAGAPHAVLNLRGQVGFPNSRTDLRADLLKHCRGQPPCLSNKFNLDRVFDPPRLLDKATGRFQPDAAGYMTPKPAKSGAGQIALVVTDHSQSLSAQPPSDRLQELSLFLKDRHPLCLFMGLERVARIYPKECVRVTKNRDPGAAPKTRQVKDIEWVGNQ